MGLRVFVCLSLLGFSTLGFGWMPKFKKCGDEECARMMSRVQAERDFTAPNCRFLSFKRGDIITVYYKLTGQKRDLWGGSIDKAFGLFPKQATRVEQQFIDEKNEIQVPTQEYDFYCIDENGQQIESSRELDDLDDPIQTPGSADALKAEDKRTENEEKQTRQNSDQDVSHPNRPESAETGGSSWISSAVSGWFDRSEKSNDETSQSREIAADAPEEDQAGTLGWISGELTNAFGFRSSAQDESKKPSSSQDPRRLEAEETSNLGVNGTSGEDPSSAEIRTEPENFLETQTQMDSQDLETERTPQTSDAFRGDPESLVEDVPDIPDQTSQSELGHDISGTFEEMEQAEGEDQDPDVVRGDEEENHVKKEEHKSAGLEDEKTANRYPKQTSEEEEDNEGTEQENQEQALNTEEDEHSMFSVGGITSALSSIGFPFQERVEKKEEGIVGKEEYSGQQDVEDEGGSVAEELESEPTVLEESDESDDLMVIEDVSVSGANDDDDDDDELKPIQNSTAPSLPRTIPVEDLEIREENIKSDELGVKEPEIDEESGNEDGAEPQIVNDEDPSDDEEQFPSDSITETLTEPNKTPSSEDRAGGEDIKELRSSEEACSRGDNVSISADTLSDEVIQAKMQSIDNTVRSELEEHEDFETVNHQESSCSDHESQSSEQRSDVDTSVDSKVEMDTVGESVNADVHPEGETADADEAVAGEDKEKERRRNEMSEDIVVHVGSEMSENAETNSSGHSDVPHVPTGDSEVKSEMLSELNSVEHDTNSSTSHAKSLEGEETSNLGVNEISEDPSSAEISTESENFLETQTQMDSQDLETKLTPQTSDVFRDNTESLVEDVPDIPDQTSTEYSTSENDQPINISIFSQHNHEAEAVEDQDDPTIVEAKKHDEENHTTVIQIQSEMILPGDAVKQPEEPSGNSETTEKVFTHSQLEPKKDEERCRDYPNLESHLTEEDCEVLTRLFGDHKLSWLDSQMGKSSKLITAEDNKTLSDFEEELETHTRLGSSQHHDGFPEMDDAGEGSALRKLLLLLSTVREMCSPVSVDESPETRGDDDAQDQDTDTSFFSQEDDDGDNETLMDEDVQTAGGETEKQSDWTWSEDKRTSSRQHDQDSEERDESEQSREEKDAGLYSQLASFLYVVLSGVVTVLKKVVSSLPDDIRPGPDLYGLPWEAVVFSGLLGFFTLLLFSCRFIQSVKSRLYASKEKKMAQKVAELLSEKSKVLETYSEIKQKFDKLESTLQENDSAAGAAQKEHLEMASQKLEQSNAEMKEEIERLQEELSLQKKERRQQEEQLAELDRALRSLEDEAKERKSQLEADNTKLKIYEINSERLQKNIHAAKEEHAMLLESETQLVQEAEGWGERLAELEEEKKMCERSHADMLEDCANKDQHIMSLTDCLLKMRDWDSEDESNADTNTNGDLSDLQQKQKIQKLIEAAKMSADLKSMQEDKDRVFAKLADEVKAKEDLQEGIKQLEEQEEELKMESESYSSQSQKLQQKLQIMTEMYQENELKLHRMLTVEEKERLHKEEKLNKAGKKISLAAEELGTYRKRAKDLEEELERSTQAYRSQIASHEKKAHDNWLAARAADRDLADVKRENANLRQRLTDAQFKCEILEKDVREGRTLIRGERSPFGPSPHGRPSSETRNFLSPPTLMDGPPRVSPQIVMGNRASRGAVEPPSGGTDIDKSGPHSDSGSLSPSWDRDRRAPPGPPGHFPDAGYGRAPPGPYPRGSMPLRPPFPPEPYYMDKPDSSFVRSAGGPDESENRDVREPSSAWDGSDPDPDSRMGPPPGPPLMRMPPMMDPRDPRFGPRGSYGPPEYFPPRGPPLGMRGPLPPRMFPRAPPPHMGYLPPRPPLDAFLHGAPPRPSPPGSEEPPDQSPPPDVI